MKRSDPITIPPKSKMCVKFIVTLINDVTEETLHIKIKGTDKELTGYNIRLDQAGSLEVKPELKTLDESCPKEVPTAKG